MLSNLLLHLTHSNLGFVTSSLDGWLLELLIKLWHGAELLKLLYGSLSQVHKLIFLMLLLSHHELVLHLLGHHRVHWGSLYLVLAIHHHHLLVLLVLLLLLLNLYHLLLHENLLSMLSEKDFVLLRKKLIELVPCH